MTKRTPKKPKPSEPQDAVQLLKTDHKQVRKLFEQFHGLVTGKVRPTEQEARALGELAAFAGVARFPIRVKCASMPWHVLQAALRSETSESK